MSATCGRPVVLYGYFCPLHQEHWPPRYSWNIVESGVKYHNPIYKLWNLVEKYLLNQTVSMYLFDELHKWDYSTWKVRPQMVSEFVRLQTGEICISMVTKKDNKSYCSFQKLYLYCYILMNGVFYQNLYLCIYIVHLNNYRSNEIKV